LQCNELHSKISSWLSEHAILVSLRERSATGDELAQCSDRSLGQSWHAGQTCRALRRTETDNPVHRRSVDRPGRPAKNVCAVSPTGHEELVRWPREPVAPEPMRHHLPCRSGAPLNYPSSLADGVARHRDLHSERLARYREIEQRNFPRPRVLAVQAHLPHLLPRSGILHATVHCAWPDEENASPAPAPSPAATESAAPLDADF
jgi:DNA-binding PadR family transcriptional regulator